MSGWVPPAEFEEYRLVRSLGAGAMGEVYLAQDTLLDRNVAIKFLHALDVKPAARDRFYTEARAIARLSHPNVVAIYRIGEVARRPYLVSEYVRGSSLDSIAKPVPWERALRIGLGLARGLAAAHRRDVVHRDIKAANAVVGEDDVAKLLDFGLAKLVASAVGAAPEAPRALPIDTAATMSVAGRGKEPSEGTGDDRAYVTVEGSLVGTPLYMAPELWRGQPATPRSDVYALGVVLFELVAGRAPHAGVAIAELATRISETDVASIETVVDGLPARLAQAIDACLRRDPLARPASGDALCALLEGATTSVAPPSEGGPYRGLAVFEPEHRALFFGRGDEARAVVERLRTEMFVVVGGDSGVGKSSLCRAAIVPTVIERLFAGKVWRAVTMTPGVHPVAALEAALAQVSNDHGLLLFIDQMEELVTLSDPREVDQVAERLATLFVSTGFVRVLASARSDFLGRLAALPGIGELVGRALYLLGPLRDRGMREAITGPARSLGYAFESEATIDELVDSGRRNLPLLQFTLAELWDARDDRTKMIPADALARIGGVSGALARRADQVMAALAADERELAWRVLLRLMTAEGTRAVVSRRELASAGDDRSAIDRVVERLVGARLVVASGADDEVEVVHEALFTGWPRLVQWRREHDVDARMRDQLREASRRWRDRGEPAGLLWRDDALVELRRWRARWHEPLTEDETRFAAASVALGKRTRRARLGALTLVIAGLSIASMLLYGADQRTAAQRETAEARNRRLLVQEGQRELETGNSGRALLYFLEVMTEGEDTPALRFLVARAAWAPARVGRVLVSEPRGYAGLVVSEPRGVIAAVERGGALTVFDLALHPVFHGSFDAEFPIGVAFSPRGRWLVAVDTQFRLHVWDTTTWTQRVSAEPSHAPTARESGYGAWFLDEDHVAFANYDSKARIWDLPSATLERTLYSPDSAAIAVSADGTQLAASGNGRLTIWSTRDGRQLAFFDDRAPVPTPSWKAPEDLRQLRFVAVGSTLWAFVHFDEPPVAVYRAHSSAVVDFAQSPDGTELATTSFDGTVRRWHVTDARVLGEQVIASRRQTTNVEFDRTGRRIVFASKDGMVRVWDLDLDRITMTVETPPQGGTGTNAPMGAWAAHFAPDGTSLLVASGIDVRLVALGNEPVLAHLPMAASASVARYAPDGSLAISLWTGPRSVARYRDGQRMWSETVSGTAWELAWNADGSLLAVGGDHGMAEVRHADGTLAVRLTGHTGLVTHAAFSADGTRVLTSSGDHTARIWDLRSGALLETFTHPAGVQCAEWLPDDRVVTGSYDGLVRTWSEASGEVVAQLGDSASPMLDMSVDPRRARVALALHDGGVTIWDLASGTRLHTLLGHIAPVTSVMWSPDGALVSSSDDEGQVRIWDPDAGRALAVDLITAGEIFGASWSPDGARIAVPRIDGSVDILDTSRDARSLRELRAFADERVPWKLVDGALVPVLR